MRTFLFAIGLVFFQSVHSQTLKQRLETAMAALENDEQFTHASIGLYVVDGKTGQVVFDKNAQLGLAPASTQKVVTSAAAFELLGKNFKYETKFALDGRIKDGIFSGEFKIIASGDPTFGSWRWPSTDRKRLLARLTDSVIAKGVNSINGTLSVNANAWESQATPNGWTWEDIGNYYGAGASILNWHENSYEIVLKPGKNIGDSVKIHSRNPEIKSVLWKNELLTAKAGSGDNAVIYLPESGYLAYLRGTIPAGVETFSIKGAMPFPDAVFLREFKDAMEERKIAVNSRFPSVRKPPPFSYAGVLKTFTPLATVVSPPLDSINYWFMKESINLYGEAFLKTIAFQQKGFGSSDGGLDIIRNFWAERGIEKSALHIKDGSGLSPANRLTPHALVTILQYAKLQNWFSSFYHSLPLQNSIKMKSGYISGVRSYTGYIKSKAGAEYTFAFIINNFDGSSAAVRTKMWKLLDILK
ncbi:MAG: D-alanyl-D-alanine carboxypeptidase/D-alanyl-D-alanine-endopeptidase [Chitinophagaceae bacterium]|nr:MAG: D-alanyl-D-alanine carboxypeptidase/D-alanyl-D-alanine-endopeptidase [Chitinophagaceae bacterium]